MARPLAPAAACGGAGGNGPRAGARAGAGAGGIARRISRRSALPARSPVAAVHTTRRRDQSGALARAEVIAPARFNYIGRALVVAEHPAHAADSAPPTSYLPSSEPVAVPVAVAGVFGRLWKTGGTYWGSAPRWNRGQRYTCPLPIGPWPSAIGCWRCSARFQLARFFRLQSWCRPPARSDMVMSSGAGARTRRSGNNRRRASVRAS